MRHLKRFRNWLGYVSCAAWALGQQLVEKNRYRIYQRAAEESTDKSSSMAAALVESEPAAIAAQPVSARSESEQAATQLAPPQIEAAAPIIKPAAPAPAPEKVVKQVAATDKKSVAPIAEPKPVAPVKKVAPAPKPAVASPPPVVAAPAPPQAPAKQEAAKPKPQSANGNGSAPKPESAKYDPSAVNDQTAQRLARLLVSEIKLYYMSATNGEGAAGNNIYDILKDPIDKSRQHYKQRMGAMAIESMPDYFHGELVRSLCAGDASRLGPNYHTPNGA